jgi:protein required for attachment to host cells
MTKPLRLQFVVADGAHARFVHRVDAADDFATVRELRPGVTKAHVHAHGAGGHDNAADNHDAFAREIAEAVNGAAASDQAAQFALIAPPPLLAAIRRHLSPVAAARVRHTLAKDVAKVADHALGEWLRPMELT